jgi:hypothetical protein
MAEDLQHQITYQGEEKVYEAQLLQLGYCTISRWIWKA